MNGLFDSSTVLLPARVARRPDGVRRLGKLDSTREGERASHLLPAPRMCRAAGESFIGSVNLRMPS